LDNDQRLIDQVRPERWRNPEPAPLYDLVVIGGGTAGLVSAAGAAGLGARVAIVERDRLGGDCLNTGCVPSKALLRAARAVHEARTAAAAGVTLSARVDFGAVMESVRARRADLAHHDSAERLAALGAHVFFGDASFVSPSTVTVNGRALKFRRAVIATGGRPAVPPIAGLHDLRCLTSESVFELREQPGSLLVLGGGPIGCELAQAFALLGTEVTIVEAQTRLLPQEDPDAAAIIASQLAKDGVRVLTSASIQRFTHTSTSITAHVEGRGVQGDAVLIATGRSPNIKGLNLEAAGVAATDRGVTVDDRLRTSNRRVFAAGDVCSPYQFTHAADAMARIVIQNALFFGRRRASTLVIPWAIYTFPEVAHVGPPPAQLSATGTEQVTIPLADVDRAVIDAATPGFLKVHHNRGRIVAATLVAPHAGELIGQVASLMRRGGSLADFSSEIYPYPTLADALRKAGDAYRRTRLTPGVKAALRRYFGLLRRG
jgi:pyruvate/2-oxoglutarate dehydrogenase complex dihydrolipoamide dehydrogenase (E3) component